VSSPGYPYLAPPVAPPPRRKRRWWLVGIVVGWAIILTVLGLWSVRHDPPTVPEQRNIAQALPVLDRATGEMLAAAQGPGRAVTIGDVQFDRGCRLTPVRAGVEATRDVTIFVAADQAASALEAVAKGLPADYQVHVARGSDATRVALHADAGSYVAIDADTLADAQVVTLEASTGCRPTAATTGETAQPQAGDPPAVLTEVLKALGGSGEPAVTAVACPAGGTAATYTVDGVARVPDLGHSLEPMTAGATVVGADPDGWALRIGPNSIVVTALPTALRVAVTSSCP
jgi:hypothetical protein